MQYSSATRGLITWHKYAPAAVITWIRPSFSGKTHGLRHPTWSDPPQRSCLQQTDAGDARKPPIATHIFIPRAGLEDSGREWFDPPHPSHIQPIYRALSPAVWRLMQSSGRGPPSVPCRGFPFVHTDTLDPCSNTLVALVPEFLQPCSQRWALSWNTMMPFRPVSRQRAGLNDPAIEQGNSAANNPAKRPTSGRNETKTWIQEPAATRLVFENLMP